MPKNHPTRAPWTAKEKQENKIVDDEIVRVVTNELTESDIENKIEHKSSWANASILTKNNQNRIAINHVSAKSFIGKRNQLVVIWLTK